MRWPEAWLSASPGLACPQCGETSGRPILRGYPSEDVFAARASGVIDVALGGCLVGPDMPTHRCKACGHDFVSGQ